MITSLTKIQEKQIPKYIEKYLNIAKKPTNRKLATLAVQNLYKFCKFKKPIVIFGQSPLATTIMVVMCRILFKNTLAKDGDQLRDQLLGQLYDQLRDQLGGQLLGQLRDQLYGQLGDQLGGQLGDQLGDQLRGQLYDQLRGQLGGQLPKINNDWWLITWWLCWGAFYMFGKYIGVKFDDTLFSVFMDFITNIGFIIPYNGIAFVSETPKKISWKNKKLHDEHQAAIEYADGYSLYCIHGMRVTEKIVKTPEKLTKEDWLNEKNIEVRRIIQERMPDFVKKIGGKQIHKDKFGELLEVSLPNDPDEKALYVHVKDSSTKREYYLWVDNQGRPMLEDGTFGYPQILTAKNCIASTFGLRGEEYNPELET